MECILRLFAGMFLTIKDGFLCLRKLVNRLKDFWLMCLSWRSAERTTAVYFYTQTALPSRGWLKFPYLPALFKQNPKYKNEMALQTLSYTITGT